MKNPMMTQSRFRSKFLWSVVILATILYGIHFVYHHKVLGFTVAKITSDFTYNPAWDIASLSEMEKKQIDKMLSQPFHYLGAGSQSYAFVSADGKTVLKFFRMKHQIFHLKDRWVGDRSDMRKKNIFSIFDAHKIAFEEMREDAGLIYLHLNKTRHLNKKVKLIDPFRRTFIVDLDQVEFVVQEKAELIFKRLEKVLHDKDKFNDSMMIIMNLIRRRMAKGIADHDKAVSHNFGFVGERAIQLDVGRIYKGHKSSDDQRILERIEKWLDEQS